MKAVYNEDSKRGLGSADEETKERVSREGGKASRGGRGSQ
jgi:hypothetical protein